MNNTYAYYPWHTPDYHLGNAVLVTGFRNMPSSCVARHACARLTSRTGRHGCGLLTFRYLYHYTFHLPLFSNYRRVVLDLSFCTSTMALVCAHSPTHCHAGRNMDSGDDIVMATPTRRLAPFFGKHDAFHYPLTFCA